MVKQRGVSLTELMISLFLGALLMNLLIQQYLSSKRLFAESQEKLTATYDSLLLHQLIKDSVRQLGFTPCIGSQYLQVLDRRIPPSYKGPLTIEANSIRIARMGNDVRQVVKRINSRVLEVDAPLSILANHPIMIADCFHAEIHQPAAIQHKRIILKYPLHYEFIAPYYMGEWLDERYFIRRNAQNETALFYESHQTEELITGVKKLSAELLSQSNYQIVRITLGLDNQKQHIIETRLRVPL